MRPFCIMETTGIEPVTPCMSSPPDGEKHTVFIDFGMQL